MTDLTIREAVKRVLAIAEEPDSDMSRYRFDEWQKRMFAALEALEVASGELIPATDAKLAVALVYRKALGAIADLPTPKDEATMTGHEDAYRAVAALIPDDALAELQALRADRDSWKGEAAHWLDTAGTTLTRAEAAEAELAATQAKLAETLDKRDEWMGRCMEEVGGHLATKDKLARVVEAGNALEGACIKAIGQRTHPAWVEIREWRAALEGAKP